MIQKVIQSRGFYVYQQGERISARGAHGARRARTE